MVWHWLSAVQGPAFKGTRSVQLWLALQYCVLAQLLSWSQVWPWLAPTAAQVFVKRLQKRELPHLLLYRWHAEPAELTRALHTLLSQKWVLGLHTVVSLALLVAQGASVAG